MARAAVPSRAPGGGEGSLQEPVWLVRAVVALFLVGFAAFLARELRSFASVAGVPPGQLYWVGLGVGLAGGLALGLLGGVAWARRRAGAAGRRPPGSRR